MSQASPSSPGPASTSPTSEPTSSGLPQLTIGVGGALIAVGVIGWVATSMVSPTALIPAFFGVALAGAGALALSPKRRKHAMHAAAAIGLLGFLGSARGLPKLMALISGVDVDRPAAVISQAVMAAICLSFVFACVRSFVNARRAARAEAARSASAS